MSMTGSGTMFNDMPNHARTMTGEITQSHTMTGEISQSHTTTGEITDDDMLALKPRQLLNMVKLLTEQNNLLKKRLSVMSLDERRFIGNEVPKELTDLDGYIFDNITGVGVLQKERRSLSEDVFADPVIETGKEVKNDKKSVKPSKKVGIESRVNILFGFAPGRHGIKDSKKSWRKSALSMPFFSGLLPVSKRFAPISRTAKNKAGIRF